MIEDEEEFRDSVAHISAEGKRVWFFPKKPKGYFYNLRSYLSWVYLTVFFTLPFIKFHGAPLFMLNVIDRIYIIFGVRFWPQDFFIFVLGMLIFVVFIILFTVIFGRVFCGWVCPQTIFMEMVFRKIEYWLEGDRKAQMALRSQPWTSKTLTRRILKIILFLAVSFAIANTFLMYIIGSDAVWNIATEPVSQHVGGFLAIVIFSLVFFFVYYWFREQVCLIVCPYGRMQGVMLDKNSIAVTYDHVRGEPRTKHIKKTADQPHGDCVDCLECIRVCPTGIDIRNGLQLECVNCTACMDACDTVMEKTHREKGLIRYASENSVLTKTKLKLNKRIVAYSLVLLALVSVEAFLLITRSELEVNSVRTRNTLFTVEPDGKIGNLYNIKLINKTSDEMNIEFKIEGKNASFDWIGHQNKLQPGEMKNGELFVYVPVEELPSQRNDVKLEIYSNGELKATENLVLLAPNKLNRP
ncbi:MAG: cytochrome c oxidase accessory protein CcoG [Bacteroidota bacterium]